MVIRKYCFIVILKDFNATEWSIFGIMAIISRVFLIQALAYGH